MKVSVDIRTNPGASMTQALFWLPPRDMENNTETISPKMCLESRSRKIEIKMTQRQPTRYILQIPTMLNPAISNYLFPKPQSHGLVKVRAGPELKPNRKIAQPGFSKFVNNLSCSRGNRSRSCANFVISIGDNRGHLKI